MKRSDFNEFALLWNYGQEIGRYGKELSPGAMQAVFEMFASEDIVNVKGALVEYRKNNKEAPTPHDILEVIKKHRPRNYYQASKAICNKPIQLIELLKKSGEK